MGKWYIDPIVLQAWHENIFKKTQVYQMILLPFRYILRIGRLVVE